MSKYKITRPLEEQFIFYFISCSSFHIFFFSSENCWIGLIGTFCIIRLYDMQVYFYPFYKQIHVRNNCRLYNNTKQILSPGYREQLLACSSLINEIICTGTQRRAGSGFPQQHDDPDSVLSTGVLYFAPGSPAAIFSSYADVNQIIDY